MSFTLNQLAQRFSGRIAGDGERQIEGLAPLDGAGPRQLAFLANPKYLTQVVSTHAAAVLITEDYFAKINSKAFCAVFIVPNPYATFARIAQYFAESVDKPPPAGVHPLAHILSLKRMRSLANARVLMRMCLSGKGQRSARHRICIRM